MYLGCALAVACAGGAAACTARGRESDDSAAERAVFAPTATIKDLMLSVVDPSADVVWGGVNTLVTERVPCADFATFRGF